MKTNLLKKSALSLALIICVLSLDVSAGSIKSRMMARLPEIVALKEKGIIGENNKGYLQYVGNVKENTTVINTENSDRKKVYSAIAKKQGTSVGLVGERRAQQIAQNAKSGFWLQNSSGKWYKK